MKKQIRIAVKGGTARVDENCSQATIDFVCKMAELAYETYTNKIKPKHEKHKRTKTGN